MSDNTDNLLLSSGETCSLLGGISKPTFYKLVNAGELPIVKIESRTFTVTRDVAELVERKRSASRST
jgi:excisionase family DNA binding protein